MPVKTAIKSADRPEPNPVGLTLHSRCDATASGTEQAFVLWVSQIGSLELCAHHSNELEASLIGQGFQAIEDRRHEVNQAPSPSAVMLAEAPEYPDSDD